MIVIDHLMIPQIDIDIKKRAMKDLKINFPVTHKRCKRIRIKDCAPKHTVNRDLFWKSLVISVFSIGVLYHGFLHLLI